MSVRVCVFDTERAVADALAGALAAELREYVVTVADDATAAGLIISTWPVSLPDAARLHMLLLRAGASAADARAARETSPGALVSRNEPLRLIADAARLAVGGATFVSPVAAALLASPPTATPRFTPAEGRVIAELAARPDTRSRVAMRLGITTSTLDNHVTAIKRKVFAELLVRGEAPDDGYLSMEALVGWVTRQHIAQES